MLINKRERALINSLETGGARAVAPIILQEGVLVTNVEARR